MWPVQWQHLELWHHFYIGPNGLVHSVFYDESNTVRMWAGITPVAEGIKIRDCIKTIGIFKNIMIPQLKHLSSRLIVSRSSAHAHAIILADSPFPDGRSSRRMFCEGTSVQCLFCHKQFRVTRNRISREKKRNTIHTISWWICIAQAESRESWSGFGNLPATRGMHSITWRRWRTKRSRTTYSNKSCEFFRRVTAHNNTRTGKFPILCVVVVWHMTLA